MFEFFSSITHVIFYSPIFNLLIVLYDMFGGNLGLAIIAIAAIAKLITIPITRKQMKSAEKMKEFQDAQAEVKKKYGKNKDKQNEEMAKLSAKYMPAQIGGCFPLIISLILLFQIRGVVINLVNQGFHAFNEVAYIEALKKDEDAVFYDIVEDLEYGENEITLEVEATNGSKTTRTYKFDVTENTEVRLKEIEEESKAIPEEDRNTQREIEKEKNELAIDSGISVYSPMFDDKDSSIKYTIVLDRFLVFPTDRIDVFITDDRQPDFEFYLRPPSKELVHVNAIKLNGEDVTEKADIQQGEMINLNFLRLDLSRVGANFVGDWFAFAPYLILALLLGITQFIVSKFQMAGTMAPDSKKKDEKDKKIKKKNAAVEPEPGFADMMQQSNKQMIYFMPLFTMLLSLGVIGTAAGGRALFPAAVSLFWIAQNTFVIIQLGSSKRKEFKTSLMESKYGGFLAGDDKAKDSKVIEGEIVEDNKENDNKTKTETIESKNEKKAESTKKESKKSKKKKKKKKKK